MPKRKCKICGNWIEDNNDSVPYKQGYAHRNCFNIAIKVTTTEKKEKLDEATRKTVKPKPQKELKEGLSEEEFQEKRDLCDYIRELTCADLPVVTYKLIEDYKQKYKISYKEMHQDLIWYFDLCEHEVDGPNVVGIIPYCHTEAQNYYKATEQSNTSAVTMLPNLPNMYKETKAVTSFASREPPRPQIDIAAIGGG